MENSLSCASLISPQNIAMAALQILREENEELDLEKFKTTDDARTYRSLYSDDCFWKKLCRKVLEAKTRNPHKATMKKYVKACYDMVRRTHSFALVNKEFEDLKNKITSPTRKV